LYIQLDTLSPDALPKRHFCSAALYPIMGGLINFLAIAFAS